MNWKFWQLNNINPIQKTVKPKPNEKWFHENHCLKGDGMCGECYGKLMK